MQEILHAFGIDWRLIVIQIFNFAILAALLWYFLYTPILKILSERQQKIEKGIADADAAEKAHSEADVKKKEVLTAAESEAGAIVERAGVHAEEKKIALLKEAEANAQKVLHNAQKRSEEIQKQAEKESEAEVARLAVLAAEKVLRDR